MNLNVIKCFAIIISVYSVNGLKCYRCNDTEIFSKKCVFENADLVECQEGEVCSFGRKSKDTDTVHLNGCEIKSICDGADGCLTCDEDGCNLYSAAIVSQRIDTMQFQTSDGTQTNTINTIQYKGTDGEIQTVTNRQGFPPGPFQGFPGNQQPPFGFWGPIGFGFVNPFNPNLASPAGALPYPYQPLFGAPTYNPYFPLYPGYYQNTSGPGSQGSQTEFVPFIPSPIPPLKPIDAPTQPPIVKPLPSVTPQPRPTEPSKVPTTEIPTKTTQTPPVQTEIPNRTNEDSKPIPGPTNEKPVPVVELLTPSETFELPLTDKETYETLSQLSESSVELNKPPVSISDLILNSTQLNHTLENLDKPREDEVDDVTTVGPILVDLVQNLPSTTSPQFQIPTTSTDSPNSNPSLINLVQNLPQGSQQESHEHHHHHHHHHHHRKNATLVDLVEDLVNNREDFPSSTQAPAVVNALELPTAAPSDAIKLPSVEPFVPPAEDIFEAAATESEPENFTKIPAPEESVTEKQEASTSTSDVVPPSLTLKPPKITYGDVPTPVEAEVLQVLNLPINKDYLSRNMIAEEANDQPVPIDVRDGFFQGPNENNQFLTLSRGSRGSIKFGKRA